MQQGNFYPIYYDGMSTILNDPKINLDKIQSIPVSVQKASQNRKKLNNINITSFSKIKNNGLT